MITQTEHLIIQSENDREAILRAAEILRGGGLVAIPTETVYGLAANALDTEAVAKIFRAKGRPQDNPLIVHISELDQLSPLVSEIPEGAKILAERFWPGPLTMVLNRSELVPPSVSAGLSTVAVRFPKNPVARAIITACGLPLAAPSANLSGSPSPTTAEHCIRDLEGRVDAIVISDPCEVGLESTVVALFSDTPRLLRPGAVTAEQLREALGSLTVDPAVTAKPEEGKPVASPGMKYKHYAPKTHVILIDSSKEEYINYVNAHSGEGVFALCFKEDESQINAPAVLYGSEKDEASQAAGLFAALRKLDDLGAKVAYAHAPTLSGMGLAVYNRLIRAAAFEVIKLK